MAKSLKCLERVKGIEPSSSAWKAVWCSNDSNAFGLFRHCPAPSGPIPHSERSPPLSARGRVMGTPGDFRPIDTAPRDGTVIEVMSDDGFCPYEMNWNPAGHNALVSTEDDGLWECPGGNFTWCEDAGMGPTHWRPLPPRERENGR